MRSRWAVTGVAGLLVLAGAGPDATSDDVPDVYDLMFEAQQLTPDQVVDLERALNENPDDLTIHVKLLCYHFSNQFRGGDQEHAKHAIWIILNHPESPAAGFPPCSIDQHLMKSAYERARKAWLDHLERDPQNLAILANAATFFLLPERDRSIALLQRGAALDPENAGWWMELGRAYSLDAIGSGDRIDTGQAKLALTAFDQGLSRMTNARDRYYALAKVGKMALLAGEPDKVRKYATELLDTAVQRRPDWNYGNAVHHGNLLLGHAALIEGDLDSAEEHLLRAGRTPGSPQLNSFGPNMLLAKQLLEASRKEAVLEYLDLCGTFWKRGVTDQWKDIIERGGMPDFGGNLRY